MPAPEAVAPATPRVGSLAGIVVLAMIAGALTGLVGGLFRVLLREAEQLRLVLLDRAGAQPSPGWLVPIALGFACAAVARWLVRWVPEAAGSGVQRLEAQARGESGPSRLAVLPVKFFGGLLALGSGLALGREGPTVQMGATVAAAVARAGRAGADDLRDLSSAAGGAGLAVAFGAPIGGLLFTLEEVAQRFRPRLVLIALLTVAAAMPVAQLFIGTRPDFRVQVAPVTGAALLLVVVLGLLCGGLGLAYNWCILRSLDLMAAAQRRVPPELLAGLVGVVVVLVGLVSPSTVGGGDSVSQPALDGSLTFRALLVLLVVRWLLGPLSYAVSTPGGLFAPMLAIGALLGALVAGVADAVLPGAPAPAAALSVIGMVAFFTAVVRAPVCGVVLIAEMTGTTSLLVPSALAAGLATAVCLARSGDPIYDSLRVRTLAADAARTDRSAGASRRA